MKLIPAVSLALAVAIEAKTVVDPKELVVGPLALSNARFADGEWNTICGPPEKAIDGAGIGLPARSGKQRKPELVHSKSSKNPEFLVDLPANAAVSEVVFYPRNSEYQDHYNRYKFLTVSVGDTLCEAQQGLGPADVKSRINTGLKWNCNFAEGDSISVKNKHFIMLMELTAAGYIKPSGPTPAEQLSACEAAAKAAAEQSAAEIAFLVENVDNCEKSAENTQNAIADLQKQLQNAQNANADLQKAVENKENELSDLQKTVQTKEQKIADLQETIQNKEQQIDDLQKSIQDCNEDYDYADTTEPKSVQLTLSNARFADGLYYNSGSHNLAPQTAIDGTWINHNALNGFAHSKSSSNPKFLVDLPQNAVVNTVTIYPRRNCCQNRYIKMTVTVGDVTCAPAQSLSTNVVKANIKSGLVWNCDNAKGKQIEVVNQDYIQIAEIVAAGYQLSESAVSESVQLTLSNARFADGLYYNSGSYNLAPKTAIDGTWINHNGQNGFAHSKSSSNPKFLVDIPQNAVVNTVTIYPRRDCCQNRYIKMTVTVGDVTCTPAQSLSTNVVKANINSGLVWNCDNAKGKHIEVVNQDWIQIAEIVAAGHQ